MVVVPSVADDAQNPSGIRESSSGSPVRRTMSARCPGAMRPQSVALKKCAGADVAARRASAGVPHVFDQRLQLVVQRKPGR